jgi:hypothetical protein
MLTQLDIKSDRSLVDSEINSVFRMKIHKHLH